MFSVLLFCLQLPYAISPVSVFSQSNVPSGAYTSLEDFFVNKKLCKQQTAKTMDLVRSGVRRMGFPNILKTLDIMPKTFPTTLLALEGLKL